MTLHRRAAIALSLAFFAATSAFAQAKKELVIGATAGPYADQGAGDEVIGVADEDHGKLVAHLDDFGAIDGYHRRCRGEGEGGYGANSRLAVQFSADRD